EEREGMPRADANDLDPIECGAWSTTRPPAAQQRDRMPADREPAEDFVQVDFRAPRLRILTILPVDEEQLHLHPPHSSCQRVEHAVDELCTRSTSVSLGE